MPTLSTAHRLGVPSAYLLRQVHPYLNRMFPQALWHGNRALPHIALTFDDGPDPHDTPLLVELLAQYRIPATFFVLGEKVARHPALVSLLAAAGHQVAMHGYTHSPLMVQSALGRLKDEVEQVHRLIARICNVPHTAVRDVRPPYGAFTPDILTSLHGWGYRPVMWSLVPIHWEQTLAEAVDEVQAGATNGTLLVLHEAMTQGAPVTEVVRAVVPPLLARGFQFVTIDTMWGELSADDPSAAFRAPSLGHPSPSPT